MGARIVVNCDHIRQNAISLVALCERYGIDVVGVTKACCGHPEVGRAMVAGGVRTIGESRLSHVRRLREGGIDVDVLLLRMPAPSEVDRVVAMTQLSLNSEVDTVRALSQAAQAQGVTHRVILMIETGDRREGVMPDDAVEAARRIASLPAIELAGAGTNAACIGGVVPTRENIQILVDVAESIEGALGIHLPIISGGHTSNMDVLLRDEMPARVNQLRVGEAILQGLNSTTYNPLPLPYQDTFNVIAEVIEVQTKPSLPEGTIATDGFGRVPHWEDIGLRRRAILAIGEQDLYISGLRPRRPGVTIVGASSDHLVVDVTEATPSVLVGDELEFDPIYAAFATAMARRGLEKVIIPAET